MHILILDYFRWLFLKIYIPCSEPKWRILIIVRLRLAVISCRVCFWALHYWFQPFVLILDIFRENWPVCIDTVLLDVKYWDISVLVSKLVLSKPPGGLTTWVVLQTTPTMSFRPCADMAAESVINLVSQDELGTHSIVIGRLFWLACALVLPVGAHF
jgi:hypothetical protein